MKNTNNYEDLVCKIHKEIQVIDKSQQKDFRVLAKITEYMNKNYSNLINSKNFTKLIKQLSYDCLVKKRIANKEVNDLGCGNEANIQKGIFDKTHHINCITSWTEDWDELECGHFTFEYLNNLDAKYLILLKDTTGVKSFEKHYVETFINQDNMTKKEEQVKDYINAKLHKNIHAINPAGEGEFNFQKKDSKGRIKKYSYNKKELLKELRYGFGTKGVPTNRNLTRLIESNLDIGNIGDFKNSEIIPIKNKDIFITNTFVFLSKKNLSPSVVPKEGFDLSVNQFIIPLLDIIRPKAVIMCGSHASYYPLKYISENMKSWNTNNIDGYLKNYTSLTKLLKFHHKLMKEQKKHQIPRIQWHDESYTYFFPVNHPAMPRYLYPYGKNGKREALVWHYISSIVNS